MQVQKVQVWHPEFIKQFAREYGTNYGNVNKNIFDTICAIWIKTQKHTVSPIIEQKESYCKKFWFFRTKGYKSSIDMIDILFHHIDTICPMSNNINVEIRRIDNQQLNEILFIVPKIVYKNPNKYEVERKDDLFDKKINEFKEELEVKNDSDIIEYFCNMSNVKITNLLEKQIDREYVATFVSELHCLLKMYFVNHRMNLVEGKNSIEMEIFFSCKNVPLREVQFVCSRNTRLVECVEVKVSTMSILFMLKKQTKRTVTMMNITEAGGCKENKKVKK